MSNACRDYYPDYPNPIYRYEPEYHTPVDWSWLDRMFEDAEKQRRVRQYPRPPKLTLVPQIERRPLPIPLEPAPTLRDAQAMLAWGTMLIEEACRLMENDSNSGSWDVDGTYHRIKNLRRDFRRRERGIE